ncbi:glycosyltransferase family 1 protein [Artomyces pyxidatus]|uniref:Glycosyltransferase family 1 protein n=1 Tax=Artomyces pyxidatus TaxID=48021 RepID=A0ACB8T8Z2_9AGAM|nr:glycosyltransferase family 1 protein [Artomyces pyxidatus]
MRVFVTVGSTKFDALVQAALSPSVIIALKQKGYTEVVVQCGNSQIDGFDLVVTPAGWRSEQEGTKITVWRFKPTLEEDFNEADLIISHAGSGTILDVLRKGKPLIVIPNPTLADNHQEELAHALSSLGHLKASTTSALAEAIVNLDVSSLSPFPAFDGSRFRQLLDEEMGFAP